MKKLKNPLLVYGILMAALSGILFLFPEFLPNFIMIIAGIGLLLYGGFSAARYLADDKDAGISHISIISSIITTGMGLLLILMPSARNVLFGLACATWVITGSFERTAIAFSTKANNKTWGLSFVFGFAGIGLGIVLLLNPLIGVLSVGYIIPIILLWQGLSTIGLALAGNAANATEHT